jgi:hypothetical protein
MLDHAIMNGGGVVHMVDVVLDRLLDNGAFNDRRIGHGKSPAILRARTLSAACDRGLTME